jgi:hypothetical protein
MLTMWPAPGTTTPGAPGPSATMRSVHPWPWWRRRERPFADAASTSSRRYPVPPARAGRPVPATRARSSSPPAHPATDQLLAPISMNPTHSTSDRHHPASGRPESNPGASGSWKSRTSGVGRRCCRFGTEVRPGAASRPQDGLNPRHLEGHDTASLRVRTESTSWATGRRRAASAPLGNGGDPSYLRRRSPRTHDRLSTRRSFGNSN